MEGTEAKGRARGRGISRFIVMAILQAARARRLGLERDASHSWGLNRAIFYAAAKSGFGRGGAGAPAAGEPVPAEPSRVRFELGDDFAFRDPTRDDLLFRIGDQTQTPQDFERQIIERFGTRRRFEAAWREAEEIVAAADDATIRSSRGFYARVYRPRRDELKDQWTERVLQDVTPPSDALLRTPTRGARAATSRRRGADAPQQSP